MNASNFVAFVAYSSLLVAQAALAAGVRNGLNILSGWRYEEFGRDAVNLVEGRIGFAIENGKLKLSRMVEEKVDA